MIAQVLAVTIFVIVFAANLWADRYQKTTVKILTKPLLIPLIILFYIISAEKINTLIVTGLICGFLGDVYLLWGGNQEGNVFFAAGLTAFLMGHISYITVFLQSTSFLRIVPVWFYLCGIPYLVYGALMFMKLKPYLDSQPTHTQMKIPVAIYICAILVMSFSSLCRVWRGVDRSFWFPFLGSLYFIASDSTLAVKQFINPEKKNSDVIIMVAYSLAQAFIVFGFIG